MYVAMQNDTLSYVQYVNIVVFFKHTVLDLYNDTFFGGLIHFCTVKEEIRFFFNNKSC